MEVCIILYIKMFIMFGAFLYNFITGKVVLDSYQSIIALIRRIATAKFAMNISVHRNKQ